MTPARAISSLKRPIAVKSSLAGRMPASVSFVARTNTKNRMSFPFLRLCGSLSPRRTTAGEIDKPQLSRQEEGSEGSEPAFVQGVGRPAISLQSARFVKVRLLLQGLDLRSEVTRRQSKSGVQKCITTRR